jgi:alkanesulfonate monooxygenase SsuD/methylene tetrahydromethanopterin reductase-like flavin-dependent oxidoreductase (luciferase family)
MQRLVAEYADIWNGWFAYGVSWPDAVPAERELIDEACRRHARDPKTLERTAGLRVLMPGSLYTPPEHERPLRGSTEEMAEALHGFAAEGMTQVQLAFSPGTRESVKEFGKVLRRLDGR